MDDSAGQPEPGGAQGRTTRRWRRWSVLAVAVALVTAAVVVVVDDSGSGRAAPRARRASTTTTTLVRVGGERLGTTTAPPTAPPTTAPPATTTAPAPPPTPPWTAPAVAPPPGVTLTEAPGACRWESTDGGTLYDAGTVTSAIDDDTTWVVTANWNDEVNGYLDSESDIIDVPPLGSAPWAISTPAPDPPEGALTCTTEAV